MSVGSTALVTQYRGEVKALLYGKLREIARLFGSLPHTLIPYLRVGESDACAVVELEGLSLGTQGFEGGIVLLHLP